MIFQSDEVRLLFTMEHSKYHKFRLGNLALLGTNKFILNLMAETHLKKVGQGQHKAGKLSSTD